MRTVSRLTAKDDRALLREIEIDRRHLASVRRKLSRSFEELAVTRRLSKSPLPASGRPEEKGHLSWSRLSARAHETGLASLIVRPNIGPHACRRPCTRTEVTAAHDLASDRRAG